MSLSAIHGSRQIADKTLNTYTKVNGEAFTVKAGRPVKLSGASNCLLAQADVLGDVCVGLAYADTATSGNLRIVLGEILKVADWTDATGGSATLTTGTEYFLSQGAAGIITTTPPDGTGQICQYIGIAVSTTEMYVNVAQPIVV